MAYATFADARKLPVEARVILAHTASNDGELDLKVGDIIDVTNQDYGWWLGWLNGKHGSFPSENVVPIEDTFKFSNKPVTIPKRRVPPVRDSVIENPAPSPDLLVIKSQVETTTCSFPNGLCVSLVKGGIENEKSDVIVNSTSNKLKLDLGAVSRVILKAAGNELAHACKRLYPAGITHGEVAVTPGFKLGCKEVYHVACISWDCGHRECKKILREIVTNCLDKARYSGMHSISFPALGTGNLGVPATVAAKTMLKHVALHENPTTLTQVNIVVYPKDRETIEAFKAQLQTKGHVGGETHKVIEEREVVPAPVSTGELPSHKSVVKVSVPESWTKMSSEKSCQRIKLDQHAAEYQEVASRLLADVPKACINQIERIQNRNLYLQYTLKRSQMTGKDGERTLWHGTSSETTNNINTNGFNRSYCGKNATLYGKGVYFAVSAKYSSDYAIPTVNEQRQMYQCKVLTGTFTKGDKTMIEPPPRHRKQPSILHDSVVNDADNPSIFVIFKDNQAYPEYLVTYFLRS